MTDQPASQPADGEPCEDCEPGHSGRAFLLAFAFAAFAAFVAADFALGGKLTTWMASTLTSLLRKGGQE